MNNDKPLNDFIAPSGFIERINFGSDVPNATPKVTFFVEGPTDKIVLEDYVDQGYCDIKACRINDNQCDNINSEDDKIRPSEARDCVIATLKKANENNHQLVLGLVDKDFHEYLDGLENIDNLLFTDSYDFEVQILKTVAFQKVINNYCDNNKLKDFEEKWGEKLIPHLLKSAKQLGIMRLVVYKKNNATYISFPFYKKGGQAIYKERFIDQNLIFNMKNYIDFIIDKHNQKMSVEGSNQVVDKEQFINECTSVMETYPERWSIIRGHDLTAIIAAHFWPGKRPNISIDTTYDLNKIPSFRAFVEDIESMVRNNYEEADFKSSKLYQSLKDWEHDKILQGTIRHAFLKSK